MEGAGIAMDIVAVGPDDSVDLGQGCFVRPFLVQHRYVNGAVAAMGGRERGGGARYHSHGAFENTMDIPYMRTW